MGTSLSPERAKALFDILSHHDTYAEIRDFRFPNSLQHYGPPFTTEASRPSSAPALQSLVSKFVLDLPGLRDVPSDFWKVHVRALIDSLEKSNLSESYDKGVLGSRKTLATAVSALIEYPVRGVFGGVPKIAEPLEQQYDLTKAEDLSRSFRNFMDGIIYGTALEDLVEKIAETDKLAEQSNAAKASHEFILVNLASLMHFTLILSPKGQYLLKLLGNANKLVPYMAIRQALKIGNVASMISAVMRIVLAKISVASVTNWLGITQSQDTGSNLLQHIISQVLQWDIKEFENRVTRVETDPNGPSKAQIRCLKEYANKSREEQQAIRTQSKQNSMSIVKSILALSSASSDMSEAAHALALEYLSAYLSIRDRRQIIQVLCKGTPDHLTTAVKSAVEAYEPVIRKAHNAIDLSDTVSDIQSFLADLLKIARISPPGKNGEVVVPTVGDFVQLLKKHQYSCHKFLHQCCKNGKELTGWYVQWIKDSASKFRRDQEGVDPSAQDAGNLTVPLNELFSALISDKQEQILPILDAQTAHLNVMHQSSGARLETLLRSQPSSNPLTNRSMTVSSPTSPETPVTTTDPSLLPATAHGPGAYLARWQDLLDRTAITPSAGEGVNSRKEKPDGAVAPDVSLVLEALSGDFRALLGKKGVYW